MRRLVMPVVFLFIFSSCSDDSQKAADDLCECISSKTKGASSDFLSLMKKIGQSKTPLATYKKELAALDGKIRIALQEEIKNIVQTDTIQDCSKRIAGFKINGKNEGDRQIKLLELMRKNSSCEIGAAQWALILEKIYGRTDENEKAITR